MAIPIALTKLNPKRVFSLIETGKTLWRWIKDKFIKASEAIGSENPLTKESTIEDISKISEIFNNFKFSVEDEMKPLIINITNEIDYYAEELCFIVEQQNEIIMKSNINLFSFKRQIGKLKKSIDRTMGNEISRIISLDNLECKNIVKMMPGEKKEKALKELLLKAVNNGIEVVNNKVSDIIDEINEDFEILIGQAIEKNENETNSQLNLLNDAKTMSGDQIEMKKILSTQANLTMNICEIVEKNISGVN